MFFILESIIYVPISKPSSPLIGFAFAPFFLSFGIDFPGGITKEPSGHLIKYL